MDAIKSFSAQEKIDVFDKIAASYYDRNFGSMTKTDLETLLFSEYIEHCIKAKENYDDYALSKQLGITQTRIRSLKERKELRYPHQGFDWHDAFAAELNNAKYDERDHRIKVIIQDVNVMNEIRHYIEEQGWYDECSLNKKLLIVPLDCFIDICDTESDLNDSLSSPELQKKINLLKHADDQIDQLVNNLSKDALKRFAMVASKGALVHVLNVICPFLGPFGKAAIGTLVFVIDKL